MIDNPFVTNGYAGPEYFCDRVDETAMLTNLLTNGNNIALMSPRRLGKTETEVSRWLSGTHNLTLATICKISTALGEDVVKVADRPYQPICGLEPIVAAEP